MSNVKPEIINMEICDCFVCVIKPLINVASFTGLSGLKYSCPHTKKPTTKSYYERSRIHLAISFLMLGVVSLAIIFYSYLVVNCKLQLECYELLSETLFLLNSVVTILCGILFNDLRIRELNAWIQIFEHKLQYGFKIILDKKTMQSLKRYSQICCLVTFSILLAFIALPYVMMTYKSISALFLFRRIASLISIYIQLIIIFQFSMQHTFLKALNEKCYSTLVCTMIEKCPECKMPKIYKKIEANRFLCDGLSLESRIRKMIRFRGAVMQNIKLLHRYVSFSTLTWFALTLVVLIINIFVMVNVTINGKYDTVIVLLEVKTYSLIICIIYLLYIMEGTKNQVRLLFLNFVNARRTVFVKTPGASTKVVMRFSDLLKVYRVYLLLHTVYDCAKRCKNENSFIGDINQILFGVSQFFIKK